MFCHVASHSYPNKDGKRVGFQKKHPYGVWILPVDIREARLEMSRGRVEMTYNSGLQLDFNQGHCNYTVDVLKPTGHRDSPGSGSQICTM